MHEDSIIERWIGSCLAGSGLPVERRAEVADELRSHLEQLVAAKRDAGLPERQAGEAALADFGPPDVLRRQLRQHQRMLDRRHALSELRRHTWWLIAVCALLGTAAAVFAPGPAPPLARCLAGAFLLAGLLPTAFVATYFSSLVECKVKHRLPRDEHQFLGRFLRWAGVAALFLAGTLGFGPILVGLSGYIGQDGLLPSILHRAPEIIEGAPWLIWYNIGVAALESPVRSFVVPSLMVLGAALFTTLYERSRCVDRPATLVED
jgi:hypothetical protein